MLAFSGVEEMRCVSSLLKLIAGRFGCSDCGSTHEMTKNANSENKQKPARMSMKVESERLGKEFAGS